MELDYIRNHKLALCLNTSFEMDDISGKSWEQLLSLRPDMNLTLCVK